MLRPKPILVTIVTITLLLAVAVITTGGSPGPAEDRALAAPGDFHPFQIVGKWTGTWKNTTFDSKGSIRANIRQNKDKKQLIPTVDMGGQMWGCVNPPAEVVVLKKGTGPNTWNENGFLVVTEFDEGSTLRWRYKHDDHSVTGSGTSADCNPGITFTLTGKLFPSSFNATVKLKFPGGGTATDKLNATKEG